MSDNPNDGLDAGREALRRFLVGEHDLDEMLTRVALIATEVVPGCDLASITLLRHGEPRTPVFTDKSALALDENQYAIGDGPCLAAIRHGGVEIFDASSDSKWPAFSAAATKSGVTACLSVPLAGELAVLGALNLYSRTATSYDERAREIACLFGDQLGVAAANATNYVESYELAQQLQQAMESRAVIEQAKGVLMAGEGCDADTAFRILVRASQNQNRKLRAIAQEIVERQAKRNQGDVRP